MSCINATGEFGLIIRRSALTERGVSIDAVLAAMEAAEPMSINEDLISFGPTFGQEALDVFTARLMNLGLEYFDDFFEFAGVFPSWCNFHVSLSQKK